MLLAAVSPAETTYLHPDHLGTPRLVTGNAGVVRAYHAYYPFGAEATSIGQDAERMKFTGHERDLGNPATAADDLDYMHARFCNPQLGRFTGWIRLRVGCRPSHRAGTDTHTLSTTRQATETPMASPPFQPTCFSSMDWYLD